MAQLIISLRCDPVTGKKDIIVKLHSDADALPMEHEALHRAMVDKLINGGVLKATEVGKVIVEREEEVPTPDRPLASVPESARKTTPQEG
jgi:hypothetical protein